MLPSTQIVQTCSAASRGITFWFFMYIFDYTIAPERCVVTPGRYFVGFHTDVARKKSQIIDNDKREGALIFFFFLFNASSVLLLFFAIETCSRIASAKTLLWTLWRFSDFHVVYYRCDVMYSSVRNSVKPMNNRDVLWSNDLPEKKFRHSVISFGGCFRTWKTTTSGAF